MENDAWVNLVKIIETLDDHVFGSFNHVEMQPSKQGNWHKVHMNVKHRWPLPSIFCMPRFKSATGKIKEYLNNNHVNL